VKLDEGVSVEDEQPETVKDGDTLLDKVPETVMEAE